MRLKLLVSASFLFASILSSCAAPLLNDQLSGAGNDVGKQHQERIPLQSFIQHMEKNLVDTALSVTSLVHDKDASIAIVTPPSHATEKRSPTAAETDPKDKFSSNSSMNVSPEILLQTTERVPAKGEQPTHILIDRISVQTLNSGLASVPLFEVKHTKVVTASVKEKEFKVAANSTGNGATNSSSVDDVSNDNVSSSSPVMEAPQPIHGDDLVATTDTTTTTAPIAKLKEAEKELAEKVAEIEAEPVILSARV